jgi:hypothetical protein
VGQEPVSSTAVTDSPVAVVTAPMVFTTTSWLVSGRPRQARVIWENSRCSILFHLEVPGQCRCLSAANYRFAGGQRRA